MKNDILVAAAGTVTITTEEYRELMKRSTCLDVVLGFIHDPKPFILSDVCCVVDILLNKPVITDDEDDNPEIDAVLAAATEGAESNA